MTNQKQEISIDVLCSWDIGLHFVKGDTEERLEQAIYFSSRHLSDRFFVGNKAIWGKMKEQSST